MQAKDQVRFINPISVAVFIVLLLVVVATCMLLKPAGTMFPVVVSAGLAAAALAASAFRIADQWEKAVILRMG